MKANTQRILLQVMFSMLFFSDLLAMIGRGHSYKSEFNVIKTVLRPLTDLSEQAVLIFPQNQQILPLLIFLLQP